MRKLIVSIAFAALAFAPNALASGQASSSLVGCPDDPKQVIQNASLNVTQGGNGTASFTINPACSSVQVSLVSYSHSAPFFTWENASDEIVVDTKTQTLGPGSYSFTVRVPDCYYQVDLVRGDVIQKLGPADSNNFYSRQNRLVAAENGGTKACAPVVNTPTPVAPVAITVVAPTPVAPAPVAPVVITVVAPTPVAPVVITVVMPTPVAPTPVAPTPIDVCINLEGIQTQTPLNFDRDAAGNCTPPVEDICINVEGVQTKTPVGMMQKDNTCATVQVKGKKQVSVPKPDMCVNIKGRQVKVPKGTVRKHGNCVKIAVKGKKVAKPGSLPYTP